jgi:hypothetical protein
MKRMCSLILGVLHLKISVSSSAFHMGIKRDPCAQGLVTVLHHGGNGHEQTTN